jgi:hypothetical protein
MRIALLLFLAFAALPAFGESMRSLDGQAQPIMWFLVKNWNSGDEISYCVRAKSPSDRKKVEALVYRAMEDWVELTFQSYAFDTVVDHFDPAGPNTLRPRELSRLVKNCDGHEDLTVYYGIEDGRVKQARRQYDNPLGFAQLERFDEASANARGFIWISDAPEVRAAEAHLRSLVYHELGHVFGVPHVDGTVMEANLAAEITAAHAAGKIYDPAQSLPAGDGSMSFPEIEFSQTLVGWLEPVFTTLNFTESGDYGAKLALALTGTSISGPYDFQFESSHNWSDRPYGSPDLDGLLVLSNDAGKRFEFRVYYGSVFWLPLGDEKIFLRRAEGREEYTPRRARIQPGVIVDLSTGRSTQFLLSRSRHDSFELDLLVNGQKIRL